ncbi:exodeoxyribonuclease VII small subunit [Thermanaeromonas sp. C210]|uniref:exodeoxyribonuclease VII small subunit n=1 Tax=Thermanaeromonas sp. C210 TaxID=2731925 RepID=UPI00155B5065|nr:exodeoxyribonuclease VII small subunit [Thermanaeromonas sp. C210]MBE3572317.1 exodeoxyribonuclease VII small subunit [Moorella humiferrea]GFN23327.1 exodeoxyribonuclease 7 small subunit [Thermanaeromonas sp. C210]
MAEEGKLTFEEALARLEAVVQSLEGGDLKLEQALEYYQEGIRLVRFCRQELNRFENKLQVLVAEEDGELEARELELPGAAER